MSLANLGDGRTVKTTISDIICRTMPTAAIDSGMVSAVDVTAVVGRILADHGDRIDAGMVDGTIGGLSGIRAYCEANGLPASDMVAKPLRVELIKRLMRRESAAK